MAEQPYFAEELEFVKELASESAAVAISRAKRVTFVEKANLSFVTDLDQDLEQLIRRRLGERYPDDTSDPARSMRPRGAAVRDDGRSTRSTAPATSSTGCRSGRSALA